MKRLFNHKPYKYNADNLKRVHRGILGAIIGDIVGSRLEFKRNKEYNFELFAEANDFTDDTVMTIAVADWLISTPQPISNDTLPTIMRSWGKKYLWRGYGSMFHRWLVSDYEADNAHITHVVMAQECV
jgi:ADP-ribosylglycohydrolase